MPQIACRIAPVPSEASIMMRKRQARYAFNPNPPLSDQFAILAA
jgi:hypothetical protein